MAVAKHVAENEKLLEEIAQLRTRLVAKAETIGAMQFSNVSIFSRLEFFESYIALDEILTIFYSAWQI